MWIRKKWKKFLSELNTIHNKNNIFKKEQIKMKKNEILKNKHKLTNHNLYYIQDFWNELEEWCCFFNIIKTFKKTDLICIDDYNIYDWYKYICSLNKSQLHNLLRKLGN